MTPSVFNTDLRGRVKFLILPNFRGAVFTTRPLLLGKNRLLRDKGTHLHFHPVSGSLLGNLGPMSSILTKNHGVCVLCNLLFQEKGVV